MKKIYWILFVLSVFVLINSFGIGLMLFGIPILVVLFFHVKIGLKINQLKTETNLLLLSAINFLLFTFIRNDGVHSMTINGLSAFLELFEINWGYKREFENSYSIGAFILFIFQVFIEIRLTRKLRKKN